MDKAFLERRTKEFALRVLSFFGTLPKNKIGDVIGYQLVDSGTSIGANYREANRGESRRDFIHKIGIVEKECAETEYWLELCEEANIGDVGERQWLLKESGELLAIFTRIGRTSKSRLDTLHSKPKSSNRKSPI